MRNSRYFWTCVGLVLLFGCNEKWQPEPVQHLGSVLVDWAHAQMSQQGEIDLDGRWEKNSVAKGSDRIVYQARLEDAIEVAGDVPQATATLRGKSFPVERFQGSDSLREGVLFVDTGRDFFSGQEADLVRKSSATYAAELRRGPVWVEILARGQSALGIPPRMEVFLNEKRVAKFDVRAERPHIIAGNALSGTNYLEVEFTNDFFRLPEDRNLYIRDVRFFQPAVAYVLWSPEDAPPRGFHLRFRRPPGQENKYRRIEPAPGLCDGPGPWRYYEVGNETRPAIPHPLSGEIRFRLKPGRQSKVEVAYGVISPTGEIATRPIFFEVLGERKGKREILDRFLIHPEIADRTRQWEQCTYDVGAFAGEEMQICIRSQLDVGPAESSHVRAHPPVVLISEPIMVTPKAEEGSGRNVILVSLDTLRADHLGCYGYKRETSPFLDAFARSEVMFEAVVAQSSWTLPSHVSMLSSLYVSAHGVMFPNHCIRSLEVLPLILKREGFRTKGIVDGGYVAPAFGFCLGFDSYEDHGKRGFETILPAAGKWLRAHGDEPFFLFLHTYDIHAPYRPPKLFRDRFPPPEGTSPELINGQAGSYLPERGTPQERAADLQHTINMYDAGIMYADEQMGRFFDLLKELGRWDDTVVIVTSDHGEELQEHGRLGHGKALYEESVGVPLLVHLPGLREATKVTDVVQVLDIPPTVLECLNIDGGSEFQGESLLQYLHGESLTARPAYAEKMPLFSRRYRSQKFVYDFGTKSTLLYDLASDPQERVSLAAQEQEVTTLLVKDITRFRADNEELLNRETSADVQLTDELADRLRQLGYVH